MQEVGFSYLDELNDIQRKAVTALEGPVMVIAGPGSGKTRVLTYRIAHLINNNVPPWQILALTFTNKAAREMKERIEKVVGSGANRIWAGTFHSLFARILRVEAHKIGYPNDFTIYDTDDSKSVISEILKSMNLDKKVYNNGAVRSRISVLQMFRLLYQNPEGVREKYQRQFRYVMVDEFQDTNYLQYEIVKLFSMYEGSNNNVCIVGDDAQSIYSFRGATIENILQFENDFNNVQTFKLEQNYRSTSHIVEAANEVIGYNKKQIQKKIWTDRVEGNKIKVLKAMSETEEGKMIADSIVEQKNRYNLRNSELAILYRTNSQSRVFEESLRRSNIPYRIYGGMSFYQRKEIKDMIAYMRLTVNDKDDEALKRVINYPRRGIGSTTLQKISGLADDNDVSMWTVLTQIEFNVRSKKTLGEFVALVQSFKRKSEASNAYDTAVTIARKSGIMELLKADNSIEGQNRLENVNSLLDGIKEFVEDDELDEDEIAPKTKSMAEFLQTISLMTDADNDPEQVDTVSLMSVHAAKGLEYKSVFVTGLEENLFPSYMSLSDPNQIDEERRLFYVAITRAEELLTLSYANSRYQYGNVRFNDMSRFLEEISDENIDALQSIKKSAGGGGTPFGQPKRLIGNFSKASKTPALAIDPADFNPSPSHTIKEGMNVLHLKFGQGKVTSIDERDVATIFFDGLHDNREKRIMLKYAKLQIVD